MFFLVLLPVIPYRFQFSNDLFFGMTCIFSCIV